MDLPTFRLRYPEFVSAGDPFIQAFLDDAAAQMNTAIWGTKYDIGHGLLTAHDLVTAPNGQFSRLNQDKATSTYWPRYKRLLEEMTTCIRVF